MPNLFPTRPRGPGRKSGPLGRWFVLSLLGLVLSGCATKGDIRTLSQEIDALAAQQREALGQLQGLNLAVQDTLRGQTDALFESRGEIVRLLRQVEQQLITLQELTGQNQRALATLRDLVERGRPTTFGPTRSDPESEPGQVMDPAFREDPPAASAAVDLYNAGVRAFNNGSIISARRAFQQFLAEHPNDAMAPDATYYLADLLVQEERFNEAIPAFLRIAELYPTAAKVPDSFYRVGLIYIHLEQNEDAKLYLERVVNSYPDSGVAGLARERLAEIS